MWTYTFHALLAFLKETWPVLLIGFGTASLAFLVGWTTLRKRKVKDAIAAEPADPFADGAANERRAASRRVGHPITVEMNDPEEQQPSQQGWVLDRSVGGLCLMVPHALPIGSFWKVRPTNAPRTAPPVRVEVKSCVPVGADWKLHCQFEKTPSYAVLLLFG